MDNDLTKTLKEMAEAAKKVRQADSFAEGDSDQFITALGGDPDKIISLNPTTQDPEEAKEASMSPEANQAYMLRQNKLLAALDAIEKKILPR